jgi:hypothetical protein
MTKGGKFVSIVCLFSAQFHQIIERDNHPLPSQPILSIPAGPGHQGGHSASITFEALETQSASIELATQRHPEMRENDERAVKFRIFYVAWTPLRFIFIERGARTEQKWTKP